MLLWKFSFAWVVDAVFICSATLILWSVLVFMYSFSLEIYLFFCLKSRGLGGYFSWWSGLWSSCRNIYASYMRLIDIQIVRHMSVRKMQHDVIFFPWYWTAELTFCFWYIPTVLQSCALKERVSGGGRAPHHYSKDEISNEVLLGKDDLIQNIQLHLHLF